MAEGHGRDAWGGLSVLCALIGNAQRDPKKGRALKPATLDPYSQRGRETIEINAGNIGIRKNVFARSTRQSKKSGLRTQVNSMTGVDIRQICDGDFDRVSHILRKCYNWYSEHEDLTSDQVRFLIAERSSAEHVQSMAAEGLCLVACVNDQVVGMVAAKGNEIDKLYVEPEHHRRGIGTALFRAAEEAIRKRGHQEIMVGAVAKSPLGFYEKMGMTVHHHKTVTKGGFKGEESVVFRKTFQ